MRNHIRKIGFVVFNKLLEIKQTRRRKIVVLWREDCVMPKKLARD